MHSNDNKELASLPRRGIFLLPNLFTTGALFAGFYAIINAINSNFEIAAMAIFIAMVMDSLDGRVARMTNTHSAFGVQYDSLSDMVCFGVTPALVVYNWGLTYLGKFGWLVAFVYMVSTALRLARFNIQSEKSDRKYFIGLPCPAAAAVVAAMVWISTDLGIPAEQISIIVALITALMGMLMVSNLKFYSFKEVDFKGKLPFFTALVVVLAFVTIAGDPPKTLFIMASCYALSGPLLWLKQRNMRNSKKHTVDTNK